MDTTIQLYRHRFIPGETIHLKDDRILITTPDLIVTSWKTLKPRKDIARGISAYFIDKGFKISKIYNKEGNIVYWYCDIIDTEYQESSSTYIFHDLLVDILVYEDNHYNIVDLDELATALQQGLISTDLVVKALNITHSLLQYLVKGEFHNLQQIINDVEKANLSR